MFKTETHLHTSDVSRCAHVSAEEMIRRYAEAGFSTVFVSDHFGASTFKGMELTWEQKVDHFLSGYEAARAAGEKYGVTVLLSAEVRIKVPKNHYLVYGIDRDFLMDFEGRFDMSLDEMVAIVRRHNVMIIQAHPHREKCYPTPEVVDGMEVFNANPRHEDNNPATLAVAKAHGLLMTAGSDAHEIEDVGCAGVLSPNKIETAQDYIDLIRGGNVAFVNGGKFA